MDWHSSTVWWLVTGGLVAAELATCTFYLLMLALGAAAAALAAHLGLAGTAQMAVAALGGGGAVGLWHLRRSRHPVAAPANANADVNLDIGSPVHVPEWTADGTARVAYRGADWDVRYVGAGVPSPGLHVVHAVEGNRLLLERSPR